MPFATSTGGARIYYEVRGGHEGRDGTATGKEPASAAADAGPAVVLVQGLGLSSRFWFDLPERLARAGGRRRRVVVLDNRGVGRSDKPRGPYKMATLGDDVAAVLGAAGIDRAVVAGISLGGMIAQHVAIRHPDKVAGLVLLATTAGLPHARPPRARALATLLGLPVASRFRPQAQVGRALARLLLPEKDVPRARELLAQWPAAMRAEPMLPRAYFAQLAAVLTHSTGARLRRLACPTVVVTGDEDVLIPPSNSRLLARLVPGAQLDVVPSCGHAIATIDPDCIERALVRLSA